MEKQSQLIFMKELESFIEKLPPERLEDPEYLPSIMAEALPKFKKEYKGIQREMAEDKCEAMEEKMDDQLIEGGFYKAVNECLADIVTLKAGFLKGPIYRKKTVVTIEEDPKTHKGRKVVKKKVIPMWEAPSPFDIFPFAGVTEINKGGLFEIIRYEKTDIQDMIGLEGFDEVAVREVLEHFADKGLHQWTWDSDEIRRAEAEGRETAYYYDWSKIDCLEMHDAIPGKYILQWAGIQIEENKKTADFLGHEIDPDLVYPVTVWMIDRWILKISINENPLGLKYYYKASYVEEKGTFWGRGVPETMVDGQTLSNSTGRAIQNNVAIASGPQVALDTQALAPGQDSTKMWAWRVWRFIRQTFSSSKEPFMQFYQPQMHAQELITVLREADRICDTHSQIAGFTHGDRQVGGAGNTLGGFSMFAGMQDEGIMDVALTIDLKIIGPAIEALYYENYDLDDSLEYIGAVTIRAKGSSWLLAKEALAARRNEFLRVTSNPEDLQIMGLEGRRESLIETAKDLFPDVRKIIPDPDFVKPIPGAEQQKAPLPGPQTLDQAGNKAGGTANLPVPEGG
jgi:hypothetical protein